jgi:hypothetical protein
MIREVPACEWGSFLEHVGREHRAWLATVHVVDARGTVTRSAPIALQSVAASASAVKPEFLRHTVAERRMWRPSASSEGSPS